MSDSLVHALSGSLGGLVSMTVTYPLVSISTRAQVETKQPGHARESTIAAVKRIIAQEGVSGLFAGLESSLGAISLTNGIFYLAFEESRALVLRRKAARGDLSKTLSTLESMGASFVAGCITSICTNPLWVINTQQTVASSLNDTDADGTVQTKRDPKTGEKIIVRKLGFLQTFTKIYKKDGLLAFFRGLGPALILVINPIIAYTSFEQLKNLIIARRSRAAARLPTGSQGITSKPTVLPLSDLDNFFLAALCKLLATGVTYPYLVVKSRMQAGATRGRKYNNALHGLSTIVSEEGVGALYRGITSKLVQSVLTAAFLFASKERIYLLTKEAIRKTVKVVPKA